MLLSVTEETKNILDKYEQAQSQQSALGHIKDTNNQLNQIKSILEEIVVSLQLLLSRIEAEPRALVFSNIENILIQINNSRENFQKENYQQARKLDEISQRLSGLRKEIERNWMIYAQDKVRSYNELKRLAERLPQMQGTLPKLNNLEKSLEAATRKLPSLNAWTRFHSQLDEFASLLSDIQGLSHDERTFLDKVLANNATIRDVTPELLTWLGEMDLLDALTIRFKDED